MMISTRGRYALRVMIDLAEHGTEGYVPMREVAARQGISLKYLERIMPVLAKNNLVEGQHGKGGGYRLTRRPAEYGIDEILRLTEGELTAVSCLAKHAKPCPQQKTCRTVPLWRELQSVVDAFLKSKTLENLMQ